MINRISAKFEAPELAEHALFHIRNSVNGICSTHISYRRASSFAEKLRGGSVYTLIPTASAAQNYNFFTAVIESPASEELIEEPYRSKTTTATVICKEESAPKVSSMLHSLGGYDVKTEK